MFGLSFGGVWILLALLSGCRATGDKTGNEAKNGASAGTVIRFSVKEDHQVCLPCGAPDSADVVWTHRDRKVLVSRQGRYETNEDRGRYLLLSDGGLCLLRLDDADAGEFCCNERLVAELQVLTGQDVSVSAGRTLLLPCSGSSKLKKRWSHRRAGGRGEVVLTRFRNGTVKAERSRVSFGNEALQIRDLQPDDAGEYQCNGELQARVSVLTGVKPEPTSVQDTSSTPATAAAMATDVIEVKKEEKRSPESALLLAAVVGLMMMILLSASVCVFLSAVKFRRNLKHRRAAVRHDATELQPWKTSNTHTERGVQERPSVPEEETLHYASLGRHNWRDRPCRTPPDQNHHDVIYSSVVTGPPAKRKRSPLPRVAAL